MSGFKFPFLIILIFIFSLNSISSARERKGSFKISKHDRILILAPHPDDETIATGGVIQAAIKKRAKIKVVYLTCGEFNQFSYIIYEKRIPLREKSFIKFGRLRTKEAKSAMKVLGLKEEDLLFLGYPDRGTLKILYQYWGEASAYKNEFTRIDRVPYRGAFSYQAQYKGENILNDLEKILLEFKPTKIFVSHPADTNPDHQSFYLYLKIALLDLEGKVPLCQIYPYLIHHYGWPKLRRYHPELELISPLSDIKWLSYNLSPDEIETKFKAMLCYKSQTEISSHYLFSFIRKNELFGDYPDLVLEADSEDLNWVSESDPKDDSWSRKLLKNADIKEVSYALNSGQLYIKIYFYNKIAKNLTLNIYLLGYREDEDFPQMPKIRIKIKDSKAYIYDKRRGISATIRVKRETNSMLILVPIKLLGNPNLIFTHIISYRYDLFLDSTPWRILRFKA